MCLLHPMVAEGAQVGESSKGGQLGSFMHHLKWLLCQKKEDREEVCVRNKQSLYSWLEWQ